MPEFSKEFFCKERKEDFLVSELMKHAWAAQMDVLQKVIEICERNGITYYVYFGTLLGTIRHQGFIPWDDDLDIAMKRDDYVRFLEVAEEELPKEYWILNVYTRTNFQEYFTRLVNGNDISIADSRMTQYHNCPFAVGVDVFPLYYLPRDRKAANELINLLKMIAMTRTYLGVRDELMAQGESPKKIQEYNQQIAECLVTLQKFTGYTFDDSKSLGTHLTILYDQAGRLYGEEESDVLVNFPTYMEHGTCVEAKWFREAIPLPFQGMTVMAPKEYDSVLRTIYGNYQVPRKVGSLHDYPFYQSQLHKLSNVAEQEDILSKTGGAGISGTISKAEERIFPSPEELKKRLPEDWWRKLYFFDGEENILKRKKIILYRTNVEGLLLHDGVTINKLRNTLSIFRKNVGVLLWWLPCSIEKEALTYIRKMVPHLVEEYEEILEEYRKENWGILDESANLVRAIELSDAFFGDEGMVADTYKKTGKPMMFQNYEYLL